MRPRDYEPERVYPLLVALHGFGGDARDMAGAFGSYAGLPVLIAVPQGEYARPLGGFSWFPVTRDRSQWPRTDERSVSRVVRCITAVRARERVGKVVVFGFSQGASLAYLTGLRHPSLVDGIAAVAGSLPLVDEEGAILRQAQIGRARRVAVFIARGTDDPLVDAASFARQKDFFERHGYRIEAAVVRGGAPTNPAAPHPAVELDGGVGSSKGLTGPAPGARPRLGRRYQPRIRRASSSMAR